MARRRSAAFNRIHAWAKLYPGLDEARRMVSGNYWQVPEDHESGEK
jgi:hypothetical protein